MKRVSVIALCLLFFVMPVIVFSQGRKEALQKSKKQIEEEIKLTNELLKETQKNKQSSLNQVMLLKNQIEKRENLITTINSQVSNIDQEIIQNTNSLEEMNIQLQKLRQEYSKMAYYAWVNRKTFQPLLFVLSAESFNQAYRRMTYIQQYTKYRKRQVQLIQEKQQQISGKVNELKGNKESKLNLMDSEQKERDKLSKEQQVKNKTLAELKKRETELRKTLKEKEQANRKLQASIQSVINEEIRKASENKKAVTTASKNVKKQNKKVSTPNKKPVEKVNEKTPNMTEIAMTTEEAQLSNSFSDNKGRLPLPLEKGVVSGRFGTHPHPVLAGVVINNNGVDFVTSVGSKARTIFNGVVSGVISLPNEAKAVIVRHGDYLTVYSNLSSVFVKKGQKVNTKQELGIIRTDQEESKTELHFELWHNKLIQNPSLWIAR